MACVNIGNTDQTFRDALKRATRVTAAADRLQREGEVCRRRWDHQLREEASGLELQAMQAVV
jgi:hypothetical protein